VVPGARPGLCQTFGEATWWPSPCPRSSTPSRRSWQASASAAAPRPGGRSFSRSSASGRQGQYPRPNCTPVRPPPLEALIDRKHTVEYEARRCRQEDAEASTKQAQRVVEWARSLTGGGSGSALHREDVDCARLCSARVRWQGISGFAEKSTPRIPCRAA
jgi:hypothetical protein